PVPDTSITCRSPVVGCRILVVKVTSKRNTRWPPTTLEADVERTSTSITRLALLKLNSSRIEVSPPASLPAIPSETKALVKSEAPLNTPARRAAARESGDPLRLTASQAPDGGRPAR